MTRVTNPDISEFCLLVHALIQAPEIGYITRIRFLFRRFLPPEINKIMPRLVELTCLHLFRYVVTP
jgi:hypothetical protein